MARASLAPCLRSSPSHGKACFSPNSQHSCMFFRSASCCIQANCALCTSSAAALASTQICWFLEATHSSSCVRAAMECLPSQEAAERCLRQRSYHKHASRYKMNQATSNRLCSVQTAFQKWHWTSTLHKKADSAAARALVHLIRTKSEIASSHGSELCSPCEDHLNYGQRRHVPGALLHTCKKRCSAIALPPTTKCTWQDVNGFHWNIVCFRHTPQLMLCREAARRRTCAAGNCPF